MERERALYLYVGRWSSEENKIFEKALALYDTETPEKWHKIAKMIPGKSVEELKRHYKHLEEDVKHIEAGLIPININTPGIGGGGGGEGMLYSSFGSFDDVDLHTFGPPPGNSSRNYHHHHNLHRKKGIPWTEEEHRLFLMGLKKYGKGDWRNISRNFVTSRTPTQVASHAQKYFLRLSNSGSSSSSSSRRGAKRRSSIHDITTANLPPASVIASSKEPTTAMPYFFPHTTAPLKLKLHPQNMFPSL